MADRLEGTYYIIPLRKLSSTGCAKEMGIAFHPWRIRLGLPEKKNGLIGILLNGLQGNKSKWKIVNNGLMPGTAILNEPCH